MARKIDWTTITVHPAQGRRRMAAAEQLELVGTDFEITDALAHPGDGGLLMLQIINGQVDGQRAVRTPDIEEIYRKPYHLRVLKLANGGEPHEGQTIEWRVERRLRDALGKKITSRHIKELHRRGELRTIETWHEAVIDQHGCITVAFEDALLLLDTKGVHYVSKGPLTGMKEITGSRHNWLYEEVPEAEYKSLKRKKKTAEPQLKE